MEIIFDLILIIFGSIFMFKAYKRIVFNKATSIANFINIIVYIFCVVPIILNYVIGKPSYESLYWYRPFIDSMSNKNVNIIYDIYILVSMFTLYRYSKRAESKNIVKYDKTAQMSIFNNKFICFLVILLPIIYILISGTESSYLIYNTSTLRGTLTSDYLVTMNSLILLSMWMYFKQIFSGKFTKKKFVVTVIYVFALLWISGKRFMIANCLMLVVFFINYMDISDRIRKKILLYIAPITGVLLVIFSAFYLTNIKVLSDTSIENVYDMLRVDFGRDDVIKYVINEELFEKNQILEYRGQSFLSTFLAFFPRSLWQGKPYPHYRYLTASILNLDVNNLPAGTTPSWYEMCICNFSYAGFVVACVLLVVFCYIIDKNKTIGIKSLGLLLLSVLLTQSIDAYVVYVLILIIDFGLRCIVSKKRKAVDEKW